MCHAASMGKARGESPKETTGNLQALPLRCSISHRCPENPNYSTFKCKALPQHPVVMFVFRYGAVASTHSYCYHSVAVVLSLAPHSTCHHSDAMVPSLARTARRTILYSASLSRISLHITSVSTSSSAIYRRHAAERHSPICIIAPRATFRFANSVACPALKPLSCLLYTSDACRRRG